MRTLYVGGLNKGATEQKLRELFGAFGRICDARVVLRPKTGQCRGFGYVTFDFDRDALHAMTELDGVVIRGTRLRVDLAQ